MRKQQVKRKAGNAVGRVERQVKEWTADTKAELEDTAAKVKGKAVHALDKIKDAARDVKDEVIGKG